MLRKKITIVIVAVVTIGLVAAFVILNKLDKAAPNAGTPIVHDGWVFKNSVKPSLEVDSLQAAGNQIMIAKVDSPLPCFAVIRDASSNKIIGASNVIAPPGSVDTKIDVTTVAGKSYSAELHADGDNNGFFDAALDPPFLFSGKIIGTSFKVK